MQQRGYANRRRVAGIAIAALAMLAPVAASGVTMTTLKDSGHEADYGTYAPGGDCSRTPRISIGDGGFGFVANGRTVTGHSFELAAGYWGRDYEGISHVFFPFPKSDDDYGMVQLTTSPDEKRGTLLVEAYVPKGQRIDPFEGAFVRPTPYIRCKGTEVAVPAAPPPPPAAPAVPLDWSNLAAMTGKYQGDFDAFDKGPVAAAIRGLMGAQIDTLKNNLDVGSPLQRDGNIYYFSGNAPHMGGEDQAYVLIDPRRRAVQVGLWDHGSLAVHVAGSGGRIALPGGIAELVASSPPEGAVATPGTPWEVVPVEGHTPIAYVNAAASPRIKAFSVFCEGSQPMLAMLTVKPIADRPVTLSWVFNGGISNLAMAQGNREGTYWQANLAGSPLLGQLDHMAGVAYLRINGTMEGQASLAGSSAALRTAMQSCRR